MLRCYLTGSICLLCERAIIREDRLPGRQGRIAFAYLVSERRRAVPRDELAEVIWPDCLPRAWDVALSALVSKVRALLAEAGLGRDVIAGPSACYQAQLPAGTWVDTEAALLSVHEAEGALQSGRREAAYGAASVAAAIARRDFLPGLEGSWIESTRVGLRTTLVRALECLAEVQTRFGQTTLALRSASEVVRLEPYRESGYQRLMRVHLAVGNRAEALTVYEQCRRVLSSDLGVVPTAETRAVMQEVPG